MSAYINKEQQYLSIHVVARRLGVCRQTVAKYIQDGRLSASNISNGASPRWRISANALKLFLQNKNIR